MSVPNSEEEAIFHSARRLAPSERSAYVKQACGSDPALLARIEALLLVLADNQSFLESPPQGCSAVVDPSIIERPGALIGHYKLLESIGEGGFGVVFMAEQLEPIRRRVALKVIKPGMDTRQVIARFEAERQALALMEHPNIARVLDGGQTAAGRPYFVMELVPGVPITEFCDRAQLPVPRRLELFVDICFAVQHAHQKGIIHRDLKPSNVLVTLHDDKPVVKVIDFGIAKAIGQQLTDKTLFTAFAQMLGTPMYMSPEQAEFAGLDVDTRTDVYALGALLYELVTGATIFDRKRLETSAFDEVRRIIREEEPAKPSTRIRTMDAESTHGAHRESDPLRLSRLSRGELDWIVMKCLEKDRTRRYESASALARDVQRILSNEPVEAGPPSTTYRLRKLFARHKAAVLTSALVLLVLVCGSVGTTMGLIKAERQRVRAVAAEQETRTQRDKALAAADSAQKRLSQIEKGNAILGSIFRELDPDAEEREGKTLRVLLGDRLEDAVNELEGEAVGDPLVVARMQLTLAKSLLSLGNPERGTELLAKARTTFTDALGIDHADALDCLRTLALGYRTMGRLDLCLPLSVEALRLTKAKLGAQHPDTLECMSTLGSVYSSLGDMDRALPLLEETLALRRTAPGASDPSTIITMNNLALTYRLAGKLAQSIELSKEALELAEQNLGSDHGSVLVALINLSTAYHADGRPDLALPLLEEVQRRSEAKLGPDNPWSLTCMTNLGVGYMSAGKLEEAVTLLERAAVGIEKRKFAHEHAGAVIGNLGTCLERLKRFDEAEVWRRKWLDATKAKDGADSEAYAKALSPLASNLVQQKKWSDAEPLLLACVEIRKTISARSKQRVASAPESARPASSAPETDQAAAKERDARLVKDGEARAIKALEELIDLYVAWGNDVEVERWRAELADTKARRN